MNNNYSVAEVFKMSIIHTGLKSLTSVTFDPVSPPYSTINWIDIRAFIVVLQINSVCCRPNIIEIG